jgi:hypothetical protein
MKGWENNMKLRTLASVHAIVLAVTALLLLPLQAHAERDWEFSVSAFGGKALHSNESVRVSQGPVIQNGIVTGTYTNGTWADLNLNDAPTLGGGNSQLGIFPDNINGNPKLVLSLTGRDLLPISIHRGFLPQEPCPFLEWSWEASHSTGTKISASMY